MEEIGLATRLTLKCGAATPHAAARIPRRERSPIIFGRQPAFVSVGAEPYSRDENSPHLEVRNSKGSVKIPIRVRPRCRS